MVLVECPRIGENAVLYVLRALSNLATQIGQTRFGAEAAHDFRSVDFLNNPAHRSKTFDPA